MQGGVKVVDCRRRAFGRSGGGFMDQDYVVVLVSGEFVSFERLWGEDGRNAYPTHGNLRGFSSLVSSKLVSPREISSPSFRIPKIPSGETAECLYGELAGDLAGLDPTHISPRLR